VTVGTNKLCQKLILEYGYLFPQKFTEMKGIKAYLGEMNIELYLDAKLVNHFLINLWERNHIILQMVF
jgi:hypothetical protein